MPKEEGLQVKIMMYHNSPASNEGVNAVYHLEMTCQVNSTTSLRLSMIPVFFICRRREYLIDKPSVVV